MAKEVILTGLRSNAEFHLGNYLGAILPMVRLQHQYKTTHQLNLFVPDIHSFTTPVDHKKLYKQTLDNLKVFVAAGLDLNDMNTFIYRQSFVPAHSELTIILNNFAYFGELSRMTQFKDKSKDSVSVLLAALKEKGQKINNRNVNSRLGEFEHYLEKYKSEPAVKKDVLAMEALAYEEAITILEDHKATLEEQTQFLENAVAAHKATVGLFDYPVLMAADILLYGAHWIPVGEDQVQHVELARDLGARMNNQFGKIFEIPYEWKKQVEFMKLERAIRIRSLRHPAKKMSKSVEDPAGTIALSDKPNEAADKVIAATTDSKSKINLTFNDQPGVSNMIQILALLAGRPLTEEAIKWRGKSSYDELKKAAAKAVAGFLTDFQDRLAKVDEKALLEKLESSEKAMNEVANTTLLRVQKAVGLRPQ